MAVRNDNLGVDGTGVFPWAEMDHVHAGDTYVIRVTAVPPYRTPADELNCHIDWTNVTAGTSGRWANILLPAKVGPEGRRGPMLRYFNTHI